MLYFNVITRIADCVTLSAKAESAAPRIQTIQNLLNIIESANAGKITAGLNQSHPQITRLNATQRSGGQKNPK